MTVFNVIIIQNRNPKFRPLWLFILTFHEYEARFVLGFRLDYKLSLFIFFLFLCQVAYSSIIFAVLRYFLPMLSWTFGKKYLKKSQCSMSYRHTESNKTTMIYSSYFLRRARHHLLHALLSSLIFTCKIFYL
jgi:hypothetical protein